jgi:hypothetical protein
MRRSKYSFIHLFCCFLVCFDSTCNYKANKNELQSNCFVFLFNMFMFSFFDNSEWEKNVLFNWRGWLLSLFCDERLKSTKNICHQKVTHTRVQKEFETSQQQIMIISRDKYYSLWILGFRSFHSLIVFRFFFLLVDQIIFCRLTPLQCELYKLISGRFKMKPGADLSQTEHETTFTLISDLKKLCNDPKLIYDDYKVRTPSKTKKKMWNNLNHENETSVYIWNNFICMPMHWFVAYSL